MKLKHYRHLSTQLILVGAFLILLAVISTVSNNNNREVSAAGEQQKQAEAELNSRLAEANGMQTLDAFDLFVTDTGNKSSDPSSAQTQSIRVPDFGQVDIQTSGAGRLFMIKGSGNTKTFVKNSGQSSVYRNSAAAATAAAAAAANSLDSSTDSANLSAGSRAKISRDLQQAIREGKKDQKVIVRFKNDEKNLDLKDNSVKRKQKRDKHNQNKDKLRKKLSRQGKVEDAKDLFIVDGAAATVADGQAVLDLANDPNIESIELDGKVKTSLDGSVKEIGVDKIWSQFANNNQALTGFGMRVAILDTGIDYRHPDLGGCIGANCKVLGGYDFYYNDNDPMDGYGHGTHVAATVAGKGVLRGVAPDAKLYAYKVLGDDGYGYDSDIIAGINRSTDPNQDGNTSDHVDVISMSLGGSGDPDDATSLAVDAASAVGVVSVIAAGNDGPGTAKIGNINSPGTSRTALTVAASCEKSLIKINYRCSTPIASFSSRGPLIWKGQDLLKPDIAAPGVEICAAKTPVSYYYWVPNCIDDKHYSLSGTSMATPHVAGVVTLLRQSQPELSPAQIKDLIKSTAIDLGNGLTYNDQGAGLINPAAIIPTNSVVSLEPKSWDITNQPISATSTFTQNFTVKSLDPTLSLVDISFNFSQAGLTFVANKNQLDLSNGATDSFTVTATVDNEQIANINVYGSIVISAASRTRGVIPVTLDNLGDFSLTPNDQIDFGVSDPTQTSWNSEKRSFSITNHRTDKTITPTITLSGFKPGVTLKLDPATTSIAPSTTQTVQAWLEVNNQALSNDAYTGNIVIANGISSRSVYASFKKYYVYEIKDDSGQLVGGYYWAHDRTNYTYWGDITSNSTIYYTLKPLVQDIVVYYPNSTDINGQHLHTVIKEGVQSAGGRTTVNFSRSEAKNKIKLQATDINNQPIKNLNTVFQYTMYLPRFGQIGVANAAYGNLDPNVDASESYSSNISSDYRTVFQYIYPSYKYSATNYVFYDDFSGLSSDRTKTNSSTDFYRVDLKYPNIASGDITPYLWACPLWERCFRSYSGQPYVKLPVDHILYTTKPPEKTLFQVSSNWWRRGCAKGVICPTAFTSSNFATDNNTQRFRDWLPDRQGQTLYMGLGPAYWSVKFANTGKQIVLQPYFKSPLSALLHQDYGVNEYDKVDLSLYDQAGNLVATDFIPAINDLFDTVDPYGNLTTITAPNQTRYTLKTGELPYYSGKYLLKGNATVQFDLGKADPNPPAIKRFNFWSNNVRAERYDPAVENKFEFDLDPVGGSLATVKLSYSLNGSVFTEVALTNQGSVYTAILPAGLKPNFHLTLKLEVTDVATNALEYQYELISSESDDITLPTVAITTPLQDSYVKGLVPVTVEAQDTRGIRKVDIFRDGYLEKSLTVAPYVYLWDSNTAYSGNKTALQAVATDVSGNQATAEVSITPDNNPPVVHMYDFPTNTTGLVDIDTAIYDRVGIRKVEVFIDGQSVGTPELQYINVWHYYRYKWNNALYPDGSTHTYVIKAEDLAGNLTESAPVTITVKNPAPTPTPTPTTTATPKPSATATSSPIPSPVAIDLAPPSVRILSPTAKSYLRDVVKVDIEAFDDRAIASIDIYANYTRVGTLTSPPYVFNWNTHPVGRQIENTLKVIATDTAGKQSTAAIDVVVDNIQPYLAFTKIPGDVAGTVSLDLLTYDAVGLRSVRSYIDGQDVGEAGLAYSAGPYQYYRTNWNTDHYPEGSIHSFKMVATDKAGHTTTTDEHRMIVRRNPLVQNKPNPERAAPAATVVATVSTPATAQTASGDVNTAPAASTAVVAPDPTPTPKPKSARQLSKKDIRSKKTIEGRIKNLASQEARSNRTVQGYIAKIDQYNATLSQVTSNVRKNLVQRQLDSTQKQLKRSMEQLTAIQNSLRSTREQLDRLLYE